MLKSKKIITFILLLVIVSLTIIVNAKYIETSKDTKLPPDVAVIVPLNKEGYTKLHENENFEYYYKEHNGILAVFDKRNGYTWKSGIDTNYNLYIEETTKLYLEENPDATDEEILKIAEPLEQQMNTTRQGIANSLIVVNHYNRTNLSRGTQQMGSSAKTFIKIDDPDNPDKQIVQEKKSDSVDTSIINKINNDEKHYRIDFQFKKLNLKVLVHLYFDLDGFKLEIRDSEIAGDDLDLLGSITIAPFMGAYGGKVRKYNLETNDWDIEELKDRNDGYMFVPDGSGALIRFQDFSSSLSGYTGYVYGKDISQNTTQYNLFPGYVPFKNPKMPVYGMAIGNQQAAYVAYATSGDEYMEIWARPNDSSDSYNLTNYNILHSNFVYNKNYVQYYNNSGSSYTTTFEEKNTFDIKLNFDFLAGDGTNNSYQADYFGMALKYREYLINNNLITIKNKNYNDIPIRLDFLMSDAKKTLLGTENIVVTTIDDVEDILKDLYSKNIKNINSGLLGYQDGGITLGDKNKPDWNRKIGSKKAFTNSLNNLAELNIDVSLFQNYTKINDKQMKITGNASKHINSFYNLEYDAFAVGPVTDFYFARPEKSVSWLNSNVKAIKSMPFSSISISGISDTLYSDYYKKDYVTRTDAINMYLSEFSNHNENYLINAENPNMYLWNYTNRYLQMPMFTTQFLYETDTVPFLQIVLNNTMELYATYSNFSFYTNKDVLRMIDYNTYSSFILTKEPAYDLSATNSANYYSTQYENYEHLIIDIYQNVNEALKYTLNKKWLNREVLAPGIIKNTYENNIEIIINYTNNEYNYKGIIISSENYRLVGN